MRLGAHVENGITRFALFTTTAALPESRCAVRTLGRDHEMSRAGDGLWIAEIPEAGHGTEYLFVLGERALSDPYARHLPNVHGPSVVWESRYEWRHAKVPVVDPVIYELHVGTFTPEGTYDGARSKLAYLADLGVSVLEIMPLASFAGARGWGYDGVAHYAPFAPYGTPDDLRRFVDDAHGHGLSVVIDVVYNHFGPSGNWLPAYAPEYFTKDVATAWGDAPNFLHPRMRAYVLDNVAYWVGELRFDGLRLDAVHAIHDLSLLADICARVPDAFLITEDERHDPRVVLDAVWADDFHHQSRVTFTRESDGYYGKFTPGAGGIAKTIAGGWLHGDASTLSARQLVYCIENHDQVGNRPRGERLEAYVPRETTQALAMLLLFLPMTPLLFMGQEYGAKTPFAYFTDHDGELGEAVRKGRLAEFADFTDFKKREVLDPQDVESFLASRLDWNARDEETLALYRRMLDLRRNDPVLRGRDRARLRAWNEGPLLLVERWSDDGRRLFVMSCDGTPLSPPERVLVATPLAHVLEG